MAEIAKIAPLTWNAIMKREIEEIRREIEEIREKMEKTKKLFAECKEKGC